MKLFNWLQKPKLVTTDSSDVLNVVDNPAVLREAIKPIEEIVFESDTLTSISEGNFLDATSPLAIAKYKNNLRLLVADTKRKGFVENFMIIRDDDYFPHDWEWRVGSKNTTMEIDRTTISYAIRCVLAYQKIGFDNSNSFFIPSMEESFRKELDKIDINLGSIISPVKFRSTKHFTINTPLSYTGEYNFVKSNRNFTVMDSMNNFLNSGYAYTADYRDAYLDVTHEALKVSEQAIVLISEDKYHTLIADPQIAAQLQDRRVIVYRGEEAVAINMILSECGILPARPGNQYMIYDDETRKILENSMRNLCANNNIQYSKGHGNLFGKGGHFSDLYDGYNHDYEKSREEFLAFLLSKFPQAEKFLNSQIYRDESTAEDFVSFVGVENLLNAINEYNIIQTREFNNRYQRFKEDRKSITPEVSHIFRQTVQFIDSFYLNERERELSMDVLYQFKEQVRLFFHSDTVAEQLSAANEISRMFGLFLESQPELEESVFSI